MLSICCSPILHLPDHRKIQAHGRPSVCFLYIPLKQEVLEHLEITMGPGTTDEDRKKVEKILKDCNIKAEIKDSALKGDL